MTVFIYHFIKSHFILINLYYPNPSLIIITFFYSVTENITGNYIHLYTIITGNCRVRPCSFVIVLTVYEVLSRQKKTSTRHFNV